METLTTTKYTPVYLTPDHIDTLQAAMLCYIDDQDFTRSPDQIEAFDELLGALFDAENFAKGL